MKYSAYMEIRNLRKLIPLALVLAVTGCATQPVSNTDAKPVPEKRILNKEIIKQADGTGKVILKRDTGYMGSACNIRVYADGKEIADLSAGEIISIYPLVGEHIFSAWPKGVCGGGMVEISGNVTKDKTLMYRVGYGTNADFGIYPTAF